MCFRGIYQIISSIANLIEVEIRLTLAKTINTILSYIISDIYELESELIMTRR